MPLGVPDPRTAEPCPECASLVDGHHVFCPHCGAAQGEAGPPLAASDLACPACTEPLAAWSLDSSVTSEGYRGSQPQIFGCQSCGGAWVDRSTLNGIIEEAQSQATNTRDQAVPRQTVAMVDVVIYRPCPTCGVRMNRRNFGRYSGIVVDECHRCGTFFDAGELAGVLTFVRGGGLTRRHDSENTRRALAQRQLTTLPVRSGERVNLGAGLEFGVRPELDLVIGLLRWLSRWIRRRATK